MPAKYEIWVEIPDSVKPPTWLLWQTGSANEVTAEKRDFLAFRTRIVEVN